MDFASIEEKVAFIEAVLFVSKDPVEPARIMEFFQFRDMAELEEIVKALELFLQDKRHGIMLKKCGNGLQLVTRSEFHDVLKDFFTIKYSSRLSIASLEALSIIAYRQPVTLAEICDMRGVNSASAVKNLLQKKLIKISGRKKVPGLPVLYSTTSEFLTYFGLNDLSELPSLEELTELFEEKEQPSLFK